MARPNGLIIAIDGVVGAGKTATARLAAQKLGYRHLDTGAMYRAVTLAAMRRGIPAADSPALAELLAVIDISLGAGPAGGEILLNGEEVCDLSRHPEVSLQVGAYADLALVRRRLVAWQQQLGARGGVVAEGRDTGTVVFPEAELKVRLHATLGERARRRYRELIAKGVSVSLEEVSTAISQRDLQDAARDYGVAAWPEGVIELDTTGMTLEEQADRIVALARQRGA